MEIVKKETKETDEMEDFKACNALVACCILLCSPVPSTPQSLIWIWQKDLPDIPPVDPRIWKLESEMSGLGECLLFMASLAGRLSFGRSYLRYGSQLI